MGESLKMSYRYIFGPILSRRFGKSLGVDVSPDKKRCNYDCIYCELQKAKTTNSYDNPPSVEEIVSDVKRAIDEYSNIDVITITANGEPTLYPYLGELIDEIDKIKGDKKSLILSNGSTIQNKEVQDTLKKFDIVKLSLDCATPVCFKKIDRVDDSVDLEAIKSGMLEFSQKYNKELIMEILVVSGINDKAKEIKSLNEFMLQLNPSKIDLGTIDRPPAYDVKPVSYDRLYELSQIFDPSLRVHIVSRHNIDSISASSYNEDDILKTIQRRPLTDDDIDILFDSYSKKRLSKLLKEGLITKKEQNRVNFYEKS